MMMMRDDYQEMYRSPMEMDDKEYCTSPGYASYYYRPHHQKSHYYSPNNEASYSSQNGTPRRSRPTPRQCKVRRYLLTRDPKDRRLSGKGIKKDNHGGNGLGMKVVGGKEIPGTRGRIGAYIARIQTGGVADSLGQLKEGDLVLEWNGISLVDRTYEEVQSIVTQSGEDAEVEIIIRNDIDMITGKRMPDEPKKLEPQHTPHEYSPKYGDHSPQHSYVEQRREAEDSIIDPLDINGNQSHDGSYAEDAVGERRVSDSSLRLGSSPRIRRASPEFQGLSRRSSDTRSLNGEEGSRMMSSALRSSPMHRQALHERPASADCIAMTSTSYRPQPIGENQLDLPRRSMTKGSSLADLEMRRDSGSIPVMASREDSRDKKIKPWRSQEGLIGRSAGPSYVPSRPLPKPPRAKNSWPSETKCNSGSDQQQKAIGEVQLQICYDSKACILYVTVLRAKSLFSLQDGRPSSPDPFVKVYLLPGRSLENQRRTRSLSLDSCPEWNQTMVYPNITQRDLPKRHLEVSAWNYRGDMDKPNEFLGEVVLNLSSSGVLDEQPRWYRLHESMRSDLTN